MKTGIDISKWQGNIDFPKVKNEVDFVILREGYRKQIDPMFLEYVKGCKENGIPIPAVYHFCYATNLQSVAEEAQSCIDNMERAGLGKDTIIFFDFEYDTVKKAAEQGVKLGRAECIGFTRAFCDYVESKGYTAGVYANMDYYKNMYDEETIARYKFWLADYSGDPDVKCIYHQYTSSGKVSGINGKVDMNHYYEEEQKMVSVILAGHGSGKPSTKGMNSYCQSRQAQNRGLVEVRRFPNLTEEQRQQMHDTYATIIGRNIYSQAWRLYCYIKRNGNYYSDCSSSICKTAEQIGVYGYSNLNTAGMHYKMEKVEDVIIKNGIIQNPEVLQVGDALMFKGSDPSRPLQIGHTEMVFEIKGKTVTVPSPSTYTVNEEFVKAGQMHANNFTGAGLKIDGDYGPLSKEAAVMCLQIGLNLDYGAGLEVDGKAGPKTKAALEGKTVRKGDRGYLVTALEIMLLLRGYNPNGVECPGIFENGCAAAVELFQEYNGLAVDRIAGFNTFTALVSEYQNK